MRQLLGAPLAFAVRLGGRGLALVFAVVIARVLGVHEYGIYAFATAWGTVVMLFAGLGFEQLLLRQVALYRSRGRPDLILGIIRRAQKIVLPFAILLTLAAALVAVLLVDRIFIVPVLVILLSVVLRAELLVWNGVLQGLGRSELSFMPLFVVFPVTMLAAVGLLLAFGIKITAVTAAFIFSGASVTSLMFAWGSTRHFLRPVVAGAQAATERIRLRGLLGPFTGVVLIAALSNQIGLIMLGAFDEASSVGIMQVGTKLAEPASMLLMAINVSIAPKIASSFDTGNLDRLRSVTTRAARYCFLFTVPIVIALIAGRGWLLGIFGSGFAAGGTVLTIIVLTQLYNAFTGPVNITLMMTAHSRAVLFVGGAAVLMNVALCVILIPSLGATGAAIALAADVVASQSVLAVFAWRKLGVNTTAISFRTNTGDGPRSDA